MLRDRGLRAILFRAPDLAGIAAAVVLFYCLFLFQGYQKLFRDSDAGWHIRTGEAILSTRTLPRTDPYSFTRAGQPWYAWEWGADALMGAAHRAAGLSGVAMLYGLAIALGVWLWFHLNWTAGGDFLLAALLAPLMLTTCNIHWLARPHVLSWVFLLATVIWAERTRPGARGQGPGARGMVAVALFSVAWTNIHASFFLGPLIFLIYAASHWLRPLIWELDRADEWGRAQGFALAAVVAAAASLLNPYGWNLHRHVFAYLENAELLKRIGEFQSFNFHAEGAAQIIAAVLAGTLGGAVALTRRRLEWFFLSVLLTASALRSARALPLVALILLPLANAAVTEALGEARLRLPVARVLAYSARLRAIDSRIGGLVWPALASGFLFALLCAPGIAARTGFPPDQFPVAAAAQVARLPLDARILAPDKFGGYLIYRFEGRRKVFFDGRSDLYGAGFLRQYARLAQVRPGWRQQVLGFGFTHALLPNDYSLVAALEQAGWRPLYRDGTATLLVRN
ncbi:MAG: hypothetical protein M1436_01405 [Acidobacteria bacterium]|nr:hypothetical protein [Acidobacteriota bacterium]